MLAQRIDNVPVSMKDVQDNKSVPLFSSCQIQVMVFRTSEFSLNQHQLVTQIADVDQWPCASYGDS